MQHGVLAEHLVYGLPFEPFLYQPPVYFLIVARWFDLAGSSIYHARILGVFWTGLMLAELFCLLRRLHGPRIALYAVVPVVFDGWLLYIERVSYIENALMVIVVGAFLLYQGALDRPSWQRFAIAGAAVGAAASFKQTGAYVFVSVLLCWLIIRRAHRGHFVLLGVAAAVIAVYLIAMTRVYDLPGHPWFTGQSLVQVRRVLGLQKSGGTLTSRSATWSTCSSASTSSSSPASCSAPRGSLSLGGGCGSVTGPGTGSPPGRTGCCSRGWPPGWWCSASPA